MPRRPADSDRRRMRVAAGTDPALASRVTVRDRQPVRRAHEGRTNRWSVRRSIGCREARDGGNSLDRCRYHLRSIRARGVPPGQARRAFYTHGHAAGERDQPRPPDQHLRGGRPAVDHLRRVRAAGRVLPARRHAAVRRRAADRDRQDPHPAGARARPACRSPRSIGNIVGYWIGYTRRPQRLRPAQFAAVPTRIRRSGRRRSSSGGARWRSSWPGSCRSCAPSPP